MKNVKNWEKFNENSTQELLELGDGKKIKILELRSISDFKDGTLVSPHKSYRNMEELKVNWGRVREASTDEAQSAAKKYDIDLNSKILYKKLNSGKYSVAEPQDLYVIVE